MPEKTNATAKEQLLKLEKLAKKVINKSLKNRTLDYTVQITTSSLETGVLKYAAQITAPADGVQPIIFVCNSYKELEESLKLAAQELNKTKVEVAFHENRINTFKTRIEQHESRIKVLNDPNYDPETDDIPLEEVTAENAPEEKDETV